MQELKEFAKELGTEPRNFIYTGGEKDFDRWRIAYTTVEANRDYVSESNFRVLLKKLQEVDPEGVFDEMYRSRTVGKVQVIRIDTENIEILKALKEAFEEIQEYPLLDEEDHSNLMAQCLDEDWEWIKDEVVELLEEEGLNTEELEEKEIKAAIRGYYDPNEALKYIVKEAVDCLR